MNKYAKIKVMYQGPYFGLTLDQLKDWELEELVDNMQGAGLTSYDRAVLEYYKARHDKFTMQAQLITFDTHGRVVSKAVAILITSQYDAGIVFTSN